MFGKQIVYILICNLTSPASRSDFASEYELLILGQSSVHVLEESPGEIIWNSTLRVDDIPWFDKSEWNSLIMDIKPQSLGANKYTVTKKVSNIGNSHKTHSPSML